MRASRFIVPAAASAVLLAALVAGTCATAAATPVAAGDPVKGKAVFTRCAICHEVKPGVNKLGPSLAGVVGRKAGTVPGFAYSAAMNATAITWTPAQLDAYLVKPAAKVPGTKMAFAGLAAPVDRADVIAYLQSAK